MLDFNIHPVDFFNFHGNFKDIFRAEKEDICNIKSDTDVCYLDPTDLNAGFNDTTYKLQPSGQVSVLRSNPHGLTKGDVISKFILLTAIRFRGDYRAAESYVLYKIMDMKTPYFRVGKDYYKVIEKDNRYGGTDNNFKAWSKEAIKDDHGPGIFKLIPKYDDFTIVPDNINHSPVQKNCYNLYVPFPHHPHDSPVHPSTIPHSLGVLKHIFKEHYELGLKYMKCLYQHPKQMLPILTMVSEERVTGKTTFMNWLQMLFGDNAVSINPETITSQFNATYAIKNIILIDETVMEKSTGVEKLKSIATAKSMTINQKHVQGYTVPFFGKIIMATNKERDFMRIDKKEIRFWIRKIDTIPGKKNINIEEDLFKEIPLFLRYIKDLPELDFSKSRMLFTDEEIRTEQLIEVKQESKTWLQKELEILIDRFFDQNPELDFFYATATDIKDKWFSRDHQASRAYISKTIHQEMKIETEKNQRYWPFGTRDSALNRSIGRPFRFNRTTERMPEDSDEIPFQAADDLPI